MNAIASNFTFSQQLLLNVAGPVLTALVGTLAIGLIVGRITRNAQERREERALRDALVKEMTDTASALYIQTQLYWRVSTNRDPTRTADDLPELRKALDERYLKSVAAGLELESRLDAYFAETDVGKQWHRTMDFLTVRYFQVLVPDDGDARAVRLKEFYKTNSQPNCTDTDPADLNDERKVLKGYRQALRTASLLVLTAQVRDERALNEAAYVQGGKRGEERATDHPPDADFGALAPRGSPSSK